MKFSSDTPTEALFELSSVSSIVKWILRLALAVTVLLVFVPLVPSMPTGLNPLDPSWVFGMNVATSQYLAFGSELLFTYGPYASVSTRTFHPFTDSLALYGSLYLAITYSIALIFITRKSATLLLLVIVVSLSLIKQYSDTLLSSYALIMGVFCYQLINMPTFSKLKRLGLLVLTFGLFTPFGLYPLIKGSIYVLYFAVAFLSVSVLVYFKKWYLALCIPIAILLSLIFFWGITGQAILGLWGYFASLGTIISGYSDAMAITGRNSEILVYLIMFILIVITLIKQQGANIKTLYIGLVFILYLFISFKGGFVRHDGHAVAGISALYFAAVILFAVFTSYQAALVLILALLSFVFTDRHYDNVLISRSLAPISETYHWGLHGLKKRVSDHSYFLEEYENSVVAIKNEAQFPVLEGSVDTYPFDQSRVIASGYNWVPRPVFQSYAAYNPQLAKINNDHLLGNKAPDNIVFRILTIDNRYPSLDDGLSWPTILSNYHLDGARGDFLFLKKDRERNIPATICSLGSDTFLFRQSISVPSAKGLIFVEFDIKPTLLGRLMNVLFKTSELRIQVFLENGQSKDYRIIPGMAKSGFILSPLVENTKDFETLISKQSMETLNQVKTLTIAPVNQFWQWNKEFSIEFKDVQFPNKLGENCAK